MIGALPIRPEHLAVDPPARRRLQRFLTDSAAFQAQLAGLSGPVTIADPPVLVALGNDLAAPALAPGKSLRGQPTIGVAFFERSLLPAEVVARASGYALIVTGSSWNKRVLRAHDVGRVRTVLQGVDPALFHPAPRTGHFADRFCVFSGGKLALRKGQDLVLEAFRRFAIRHPEALLVTAWHSPWPALARTPDESPLRLQPIPITRDGRVDVLGWAAQNGVPAERIVDLGAVPNAMMPSILREMDVAVFPNRCEGGTNLVAMEAMACGLPTILSANTGHLDLVDEELCVPLHRQAPWPAERGPLGDVPGWGESAIDEIVEALERLHADPEAARLMGARAAARIRGLTWRHTAQTMKRVVLNCH